MGRTYWHITFGTYGDCLHGDCRPTVDRTHNRYGTPFLGANAMRKAREHDLLKHGSTLLTASQMRFVEAVIPMICDRGGWEYVLCAAGPNHVHTVVRAESTIHGKQIRALLKRWLSQALDDKFNDGASRRWWAEGGSTKAIKDERYLSAAKRYVIDQRADE